jgi:hypothetical protein
MFCIQSWFDLILNEEMKKVNVKREVWCFIIGSNWRNLYANLILEVRIGVFYYIKFNSCLNLLYFILFSLKYFQFILKWLIDFLNLILKYGLNVKKDSVLILKILYHLPPNIQNSQSIPTLKFVSFFLGALLMIIGSNLLTIVQFNKG